MDTLLQDLRYALRGLRRAPGFAAVAVLTLALGIGANTVIFSMISSLVLDAVALPDIDRLMNVDLRTSTVGAGVPVRPADLDVWRAEVDAFEGLAGFAGRGYTLGDRSGEGAVRANGYRVTPSYFAVLGARPLLGRGFLPEENDPGSDAVVVLSERVWRSQFGGDPAIVGRTVWVDGAPRTVVGVVGGTDRYPPGADLWVPLAPAAAERQSRFLGVLGRLRPGATPAVAQARLEAVQHGLDKTRPADVRATGVRVIGLAELNASHPWSMMRILVGAVGFVLLIACANVAGMLLARATARRQEIAVRASLGAGRSRIVRQLLTESLVLALAAGVLGAMLAFWGVGLLRDATPADLSAFVAGWDRFAVDARALGWTLGLSVLTGLVFGLAPAVLASGTDLAAVLRDGTRAASGRHFGRAQRALVAFEVALAVVLLAGAGLLIRSFLGLIAADPGFRSERVLTLELWLPAARYEEDDAIARFQDGMLERVRALPGVSAAGLVSSLPMSRTGAVVAYTVKGEGDREGGGEGGGAAAPAASADAFAGGAGRARRADWRIATPDYFQALGIPLLRGRPFTDADGDGAPPVVLVSAAFAAREWPDGAALGRRLVVRDREWEVVGVVGDVAHFGAQTGPRATLYVPQRQRPTTAGFLAVRTDIEPTALAAAVRREIAGIDPDAATARVRSMERVVADFVAPERLMSAMLSILAAFAVMIAGIGLYAIIAYGVERRRFEFGVRMALGARAGDIVRLVVRQGLVPVLIGVGLGLLGALGSSRALAAFLYGVRATDPVIFTGTALLLLATAAVAHIAPMRRALGVDPASALREE